MKKLESQDNNDVEVKIDNYIRNIQVIVAISSIIEKNNGSSIIGKKLTYIEDDILKFVTPDLVSEIATESSSVTNSGLLSESKVSLSRNQEYWIKHYQQIKRYDQDLCGWDNDIKSHDIIMITDTILTRKIWEYFEKMRESEDYTFRHNLAILQSAREDKLNSFIVLRLDFGTVSNQKLLDVLKYGERIPLQHLFRDVEQIKYYDDKPPLLYTMEILWNYVFPSKVSIDLYKDLNSGSEIPIEIILTELVNEMKNRFAPVNNQNVIQTGWIKEALNEFVKIKLANQKDQDGNEFTVLFKKYRKYKRPREYFMSLMNKTESKKTIKSERLDRWFTKTSQDS